MIRSSSCLHSNSQFHYDLIQRFTCGLTGRCRPNRASQNPTSLHKLPFLIKRCGRSIEIRFARQPALHTGRLNHYASGLLLINEWTVAGFETTVLWQRTINHRKANSNTRFFSFHISLWHCALKRYSSKGSTAKTNGDYRFEIHSICVEFYFFFWKIQIYCLFSNFGKKTFRNGKWISSSIISFEITTDSRVDFSNEKWQQHRTALSLTVDWVV